MAMACLWGLPALCSVEMFCDTHFSFAVPFSFEQSRNGMSSRITPFRAQLAALVIQLCVIQVVWLQGLVAVGCVAMEMDWNVAMVPMYYLWCKQLVAGLRGLVVGRLHQQPQTLPTSRTEGYY
jgi:hypothetical protein